MPIGSYPRITLNTTGQTNNPLSGTGLAIYNQEGGQYVIADSDLFPINNGGLASKDDLAEVNGNLTANQYDGSTVGDNSYLTQSALYSNLGPSVANLLVSDTSDATAANLLQSILDTLGIIQANLANGTYSIQIKGSNGNLANVSGANRLNVAL